MSGQRHFDLIETFKAFCCIVALAALGAAPTAFAQAVQPVPGAGPNISQAQYNYYGIHQPNGLDAVTYLYSANGTWRSYTNLINVQNSVISPPPANAYYCEWNGAVPNQMPVGVWGGSACPTVPACLSDTSIGTNVCSLIGLANDSTATAVPDANEHSLWQLTYQPAGTPTGVSGQAFEEHSAKAAQGVPVPNGHEFSQFWFDDNWLARYVSLAYGGPSPVGLYAPTDFNRWAIYGGGTANWTPYQNASSYIDLLCDNGLYDYFTGNYSAAYSNLVSALQLAGSTYDQSTQQYDYPKAYDQYYFGVMKILTDFLLESGHFSGSNLSALIQQSVSLHSEILTLQQLTPSPSLTPIGWITGDGKTTLNAGLINTETTSVMVLALSTQAKYTYEPGLPPTSTTCSTCYQRPYHVLSAVVGSTTPNEYMTYGPYVNLPTGNYTVEFYLRTGSSPSGNIANVDVHDAQANQVLGSSLVSGSSMPSGDLWTRISVPVTISNAQNQMEFRVYWYGTMNLDIRAIRVR